MHKMALGTVAVIFSALAATAAEAGMKLTSAEVSDGATIKNPQVFRSVHLHRRQRFAIAELERLAEGDEELRSHCLRSLRADRQRLVALGGGQPSGIDHVDFERAPAIRRPISCRPAPCRFAPISGRRVTAARARPRATNRITITSRCTRSMKTSSDSSRIQTVRGRSSATKCTSTRSPRRASSGLTAVLPTRNKAHSICSAGLPRCISVVSRMTATSGLARPEGFEPLTSAFGGQFPRFAVVSWVLRRFVKYPSGGHYLYVDDCLSLLHLFRAASYLLAKVVRGMVSAKRIGQREIAALQARTGHLGRRCVGFRRSPAD